MADSHIHNCVPISLKAIPEDTYHLALDGLPTERKLRDLFAAVPQLTRLTCQQSESGQLEWEALGLALSETPHITALHLDQCGLKDDQLLDILQGCPLELCELSLNHNKLKCESTQLITRLAYFTNLQ